MLAETWGHFHSSLRNMRSTILPGFFAAIYLIDRCQCERINSHLRVASYYNPLDNLPNSSVNKIGAMESKLIYLLGKFLNFTYEIHAPTDVRQLGTSGETKGNGSWTGVLGQLLRKEVDMSISFGPGFHSRHLVVDVSVMVVVDEISIMIPYPVKDTDAIGFYKAFTPWTWVMIWASSNSIAVALWAVANIQQKGERHFGKIVFFHIAVSLGQSGYLRRYSTFSSASRLVQAAWLLGLLVITYSYTGILVSLITNPKFQFSVRSIEDVAANENIKPLIIHESSTQVEFEESTYPTFQKVFERVKANRGLLVPLTSNLIDILLSDPHHVLIMSNLLADFELEKDFRKNKICRATILPMKVNVRANSLFLQKGSCYTRLIDRQLLLLSQAGLPEYLDNKHDTFASRCYFDTAAMIGANRVRQTTPLSLYELRGILRTFAGVFLVGLIVFLCELLFGKWQSLYRNDC